ncbi:MAG: hypothetical protein J6Y82_12875 [Bacteroidales bacterium]|nr:hypothetical protein [Bacteroidales bacterium]
MKTKLLLILVAIATNVCYAVEYVDLGLSSGTLWATCNVGATNPWDAGDYFAWGETATKTNYSWSTYVLAKGESNKLTKYCGYTNLGYNGYTDHKINLDPEDDAARANMGSGWCMPTSAQWQMLWEECYWEWTNSYAGHGVKGYIVYRSVDKTKDKKHTKGTSYVYSISNDVHIFLPQAGSYSNTSLVNDNWLDYWSASVFESNPKSSYVFSAEENQDAAVAVMSRCTGNPVRAISTTRYDLWICGVQIDEINCTDIAADVSGVTGTVNYDPSTNTLTLQNAIIDAEGTYAIHDSIPNLKINVLGTNTLNSTNNYSCIRLDKSTEITGGGCLNVKAVGDGLGIFLYNTNKMTHTEDITLSVTGYTELYAEGMSGISGYGNEESMSQTYGAVLSVNNSKVTAAFHGNTSVLQPWRQGGGIEYLHALNLDGVEIISPRNVGFVPKTMKNIVNATDNTLVSNEVVISVVEPSFEGGVLPGKFSVSSTKQVQFSQGNLQYHPHDNVWRFAERQYDLVDNNTENHSINSYTADFNGWIDLFGWGTSGWSGSGAENYQPYSTSQAYSSYGPVFSSETGANNDLTGDNSFADWGVYNAIQNGGNQAGLWRTMTYSEWYYLLETRSGARDKYGIACVCGVNGLIILPDEWSTPSGITFEKGCSSDGEEYYALKNNFSDIQWFRLAQAGAVFLPAAGGRSNSNQVYSVNRSGFYWSSSSSSNENYKARYVNISSSAVYRSTSARDHGLSVRLIMPPTSKITITQSEGGTISCVEDYVNLDAAEIGNTLHFTATPSDDYVFEAWNGCSADGSLTVTSDATVTCTFKPKSATAVKNIGTAAPKVSKVLENGTMYIIKGGVKYNLQGVKCEGE